MIVTVEFLFIVAFAVYLVGSKQPTSVTDDRLGHIGERCTVCGHEAQEPWHKHGDCWYES